MLTLLPCVSPTFTSLPDTIQEDCTVLHPGIQMVWIQKNWGDKYVKKAKNIFCDLIHVFLTCNLDVDTNSHNRW